MQPHASQSPDGQTSGTESNTLLILCALRGEKKEREKALLVNSKKKK